MENEGETIEVVLFDLGGVLVELSGVESMRVLTGIESDEEVWRRWLTCRWVRDFERGGCSADDFAAGVISDWDLTITPESFLESFGAWPTGLFPGADELVHATRSKVPVGYLSNTNSMHWDEHFSRWPLCAEFDHRFLSFELGWLKPDRELFDGVAALLDIPPNRILFLDDNQINVDGAREAGFRAERVQGVAGAEQALKDAGVLDR